MKLYLMAKDPGPGGMRLRETPLSLSFAETFMRLLELGYRPMKLFPAEPAGGAALLKALASPLSGARFCPTGIDAERAKDYCALPNVLCVGGWRRPMPSGRAIGRGLPDLPGQPQLYATEWGIRAKRDRQRLVGAGRG